jgi:SulP family sulfate permease
VGQGVANLAAACLGAIPTCGSLTRSAHAVSAGARSRLAAATGGLALALLLPFLGGVIAGVPTAAIVGLVVLSGIDLVNPGALRRAMRTRGDAAVLLATLGAALWIDLVQALYAGVFLSLALLVQRAGRLQMVEIVRAGVGRFREIPLDERTGASPVVMLHLEGDLNFAVATELTERLLEIADRGPRVLVLRLKRARHLDATVLEALRHTFEELRGRGVRSILCGLTDELERLLHESELAAVLGPDGLLRSGPRLFEGFERALALARQILAPLSDEEIFRGEEDTAAPDSVNFEI